MLSEHGYEVFLLFPSRYRLSKVLHCARLIIFLALVLCRLFLIGAGFPPHCDRSDTISVKKNQGIILVSICFSCIFVFFYS